MIFISTRPNADNRDNLKFGLSTKGFIQYDITGFTKHVSDSDSRLCARSLRSLGDNWTYTNDRLT